MKSHSSTYMEKFQGYFIYFCYIDDKEIYKRGETDTFSLHWLGALVNPKNPLSLAMPRGPSSQGDRIVLRQQSWFRQLSVCPRGKLCPWL